MKWLCSVCHAAGGCVWGALEESTNDRCQRCGFRGRVTGCDHSLFDSVPGPAVRTDHPDTAQAAAVQAAPGAATQRQLVMSVIRAAGTATDEEIQTRTGMNPSTERPRRVELVRMGLVQDSGQRRKTRSGRAAIVWEPT